jgi:hypothetical protein
MPIKNISMPDFLTFVNLTKTADTIEFRLAIEKIPEKLLIDYLERLRPSMHFEQDDLGNFIHHHGRSGFYYLAKYRSSEEILHMIKKVNPERLLTALAQPYTEKFELEVDEADNTPAASQLIDVNNLTSVVLYQNYESILLILTHIDLFKLKSNELFEFCQPEFLAKNTLLTSTERDDLVSKFANLYELTHKPADIAKTDPELLLNFLIDHLSPFFDKNLQATPSINLKLYKKYLNVLDVALSVVPADKHPLVNTYLVSLKLKSTLLNKDMKSACKLFFDLKNYQAISPEDNSIIANLLWAYPQQFSPANPERAYRKALELTHSIINELDQASSSLASLQTTLHALNLERATVANQLNDLTSQSKTALNQIENLEITVSSLSNAKSSAEYKPFMTLHIKNAQAKLKILIKQSTLANDSIAEHSASLAKLDNDITLVHEDIKQVINYTQVTHQEYPDARRFYMMLMNPSLTSTERLKHTDTFSELDYRLRVIELMLTECTHHLLNKSPKYSEFLKTVEAIPKNNIEHYLNQFLIALKNAIVVFDTKESKSLYSELFKIAIETLSELKIQDKDLSPSPAFSNAEPLSLDEDEQLQPRMSLR